MISACATRAGIQLLSLIFITTNKENLLAAFHRYLVRESSTNCLFKSFFRHLNRLVSLANFVWVSGSLNLN